MTTVIVLIYTICLLVGTYTHSRGLLQKGFLASPVPLAIGVYWDMLTGLDPLAAVLLWWRPKAGIWLTTIIIGSDVILNTSVYLAGYFGPPVPGFVPMTLLCQSLFGLFVLTTAPGLYPRRPSPAPPAS